MEHRVTRRYLSVWSSKHLKISANSLLYLFYDGSPYHTETSPLIYSANQWTDSYMIATSVMKELNKFICNLVILRITGSASMQNSPKN